MASVVGGTVAVGWKTLSSGAVVTAGSVVYPRNLIIGNVIGVGFTDNGVEKYAIIEPAADIAKLEQVFILTQFGVE